TSSASFGDGRVIAINSSAQAVIEQIIDGVKTYWLWDRNNDPIEIPAGTAGRGGFIATSLSDAGVVGGRWNTGDLNSDLSIRYHAAYWVPGNPSPTDLTPMDSPIHDLVIGRYFDVPSFQYLPNSIPMSWC